jgi:type VI secretion system protein ImpK
VSTAAVTTNPSVFQRRPENLSSIFQEILTAIMRLRTNRESVSNAQEFRAMVQKHLKLAEKEARALGYSAQSVRLALFAVIALVDESVLNRQIETFSDWAGNPLQKEWFGSSEAGNVFFQNVDGLLNNSTVALPETEPSKVADLLELHQLCLLLGYRGRYGDTAQRELRMVVESIGDTIGKSAALSKTCRLHGNCHSRGRSIAFRSMGTAAVVRIHGLSDPRAPVVRWIQPLAQVGNIDFKSLRNRSEEVGTDMIVYVCTACALLIYLVAAWVLGSLLGLQGRDLWIFRGGLALIGCVAGAAVVWFYIKTSKQKAGALSPGLKGSEIDGLIREANAGLKSCNLGRRPNLKKLPVVFVLGNSKTGKTSNVVQSGLEAKLLAGQVYEGSSIVPVHTRLANFWYARNTVFVEVNDTAVADTAWWSRLLRRLQPGKLSALKGGHPPRAAIVCFSCETFGNPPELERLNR